jgi:hypothetical protein
MESLRTTYDLNLYNQKDCDDILREKYPHRNEKYYGILLKALDNFIQPSFKLNLTAQNIKSDN